jgi:hypothetical protein
MENDRKNQRQAKRQDQRQAKRQDQIQNIQTHERRQLNPLCTFCALFGHIRGRCRFPEIHLPSDRNEEARENSRRLYRFRNRLTNRFNHQ